MEKLELRVGILEDEMKEMKKYKDECAENNNETKTGLAVAVQKMNDLIKTVEQLPENLEKSMMKSMELQAKEHEKMYDEIREIKRVNEKLQVRINELERLIDERTVEEDSKTYKQIKYMIAITIITGIISFALGLILKQ